MRSNAAVLCGFCPNPQCGKRLYFPENEASVECFGCGQRYGPSVLKNVERLTNDSDIVIGIVEALDRLLNARTKSEAVKKETVDHGCPKVDGMTNYLCTILSPLLTSHGMDRVTGKAKLLTEMGKSPVFDCGQLCDRAFLIDPAHLGVPSFGRDRSGSMAYLQDTLDQIKLSNEREERLVPVHADGDGHCLVHAVSRALIGWELFWHPLRVNLKQHLIDNLATYKMQFQDFVDESEWTLIINECDPDFVPSGLEPTGLRNIHIFGLANVLRRPIVLLDCLEGIQSSGDYSAIFLPYFSPPSACKNKEGRLNNPLCIAWSSLGRNHFIPLVGVKGKKCPLLSRYMIQRSWGVSDAEIDNYVHFDDMGRCQIGGEKILQSSYIQRLVAAMSEVFFERHKMSPTLLSDVQEQIFKANGLVCGLNVKLLLDKAKAFITQELLFVCLNCRALALAQSVSRSWLCPGGELYDLAVSCHGPKLKDGQSYSFPLHNVVALYDAKQDKLVTAPGQQRPSACLYCSGIEFRLVNADYSIQFKDGDRTFTESKKCLCGFKLYWNGKEYDTAPKKIPVLMDWGGKTVKSVVPWFQGEEDPSLNSNVYAIAQDLVQTHFPGEFGSERLVQKVVDQILIQTASPEPEKGKRTGTRPGTRPEDEAMETSEPGQSHSPVTSGEALGERGLTNWSPQQASKALLMGLQRQSVHREELNKSAVEKRVHDQIEANAPKQQQKLSARLGAEKKKMARDSLQKPLERQTLPATAQDQIPNSPSEKITPKTPTSKCIRLSLSDNRHMTLDLPAECKFLELQALISAAISLPATRLRIRHGFPPRELKPPTSADEDYRVPVQPGDRIMVDIIGGSTGEEEAKNRGSISSSAAPLKVNQSKAPLTKKVDPPWMSLAEGGMDEVSDRVLQGLMDPLLNSGGDSLDHSLSALALTAALENRDLWTHAQRLPHLFSVNGVFYRQVERDIGLEHGRHYQVPLLPHKVFVYNSHADRLELCLEPYGHFPVEVNVERNSESMLPSGRCNKQMPFSGHGHVLKSSQEERMPTDVPMSPKRHEARRLNTLCDPAVHQESIEEEEEEEEAENNSPSHRLSPSDIVRDPSRGVRLAGASRTSLQSGSFPLFHQHHQESKLVRRAPGYSELSPIPENVGLATLQTDDSGDGGSADTSLTQAGGADIRTDMLHQLVSRIEQAVEMMGSEAQAISEGKRPTFSGRRLPQVDNKDPSPMQASDALAKERTSSTDLEANSCMDQTGLNETRPFHNQMTTAGSLSSHSQSVTNPECVSYKDRGINSGQESSATSFAHDSTIASPAKRRQLPVIPITAPLSSFIATAPSVSSPPSVSSAATTSPERKAGGHRGSGMRNSGGNSKDLLLSAVTPSSAVAAIAGQVALDIAAMDTEDVVPQSENLARANHTEEAAGEIPQAESISVVEAGEKTDENMEVVDTRQESLEITEERSSTQEHSNQGFKEDMESP